MHFAVTSGKGKQTINWGTIQTFR